MTRNSLLILILLAASGLALRAIFFSVSVSSIHVSGDESIFALQSTAITQDSESEAFQAKQHPRGIRGRFPLLFMAQPYLFPLESYLSAPLMPLLPYNAGGIRLPLLLMGLVTTVLCLRLVQSWGTFSRTWPAWLLILIPSPYLMTFFAAYSPPSYPSLLLFIALVLNLTRWRPEKIIPAGLSAGISGFATGLICSGTLLAAPLVPVAGALVCLRKSWRTGLLCALLFAAGVTAGLAPYWFAKKSYPGAYDAVSGTVPAREALSRLVDPVILFSIPHTLGYRTTIIPDAAETAGILPARGAPVAGVAWTLLLVIVMATCGWRLVQRWMRDRRPSVETADAMAGISAAAVILFLFSSRFAAGECRYLLPLALCLPLLTGWLYSIAGSQARRIIGIFAVAWALVNIGSSAALLRWWSASGFDGIFNDARPAVAELQKQNITHAYASYFDAYAINYLSGETIVCSQPYNERFFSWPLPYKEAVDAATHVAFALGPSHRFKAEYFEADMARMGVTYRTETAGKFKIYSEFKTGSGASVPVDIPYTVHSAEQETALEILHDGNYTTRWESREMQKAGFFLELRLSEPRMVDAIYLYYNFAHHRRPEALSVRVPDQAGWRTVAENAGETLCVVELANGHPVYGNQHQLVSFPPVMTDRVRIEIARPAEGKPWLIGEIVPRFRKE